MPNIQIESVYIKNYLSIDEIEIDFTAYDNGLVFITGENLDDNTRNGVGKSSILSALHYALFGEPIGKIKKAQIPNRKLKRHKTIVILKYSVDSDKYEIHRTIPNDLKFYKNGIDKTRTIVETNNDILASLDIDKLTLFQNLFVLNNGDISFFEKSSADKIKYIESVLNLQVFETLFDSANTEFKRLKKIKDSLDTKIIENERSYTSILNNFNNFETVKIEKLKTLQNDLDDITSRKNLLIASKDALVYPEINIIEDYDNRRIKLDSLVTKNKESISILKKEHSNKLSELSELEKSLKCPSCKREYTDSNEKEEKIKSIRLEITDMLGNLSALESKKIQLENSLKVANEYKLKLNEISIIDGKKRDIDKDIENQNVRCGMIQSRILEERLAENPFESVVDDLDKRIQEYKGVLVQVDEKYKVYNLLKYVYSPEGVKNFIIKKIINLFNEILSNYLKELQSPFVVSFDEYFEETITHLGDDASYNSMSNGEKARVNIAVLFAFKSLRKLQTGLQINISFYDEIFDSSLCEFGMRKCMDILEKMNQTSYVVTHRSENVDISKHKKIELIKKKGLTTVAA